MHKTRVKLFPNFTRHHLITHTNLLGSKTLIEQRLSEILYSVFKLVNNNTNPESLSELLSLREKTYAMRGKDILKVPKDNTTRFGLNSWRYQAPKIWNNLPDVVRASFEFKTFKRLWHTCELAGEVLYFFS